MKIGERMRLSRETTVFLGAEESPFLAPRGVYLVDRKLIVADTAQNRVFIWNKVPKTTFENPDVVLGQEDSGQTGRNASGKCSDTSMFYPSGLWSNGEMLVVADAWNHRVLVWSKMPESDRQPADVVIGQGDFESNQPNGGIGEDPSSSSLNWPYGVYSDGKSLWIADTGNRRVLYYESIPTQNGSPANSVIGKDSFNKRDYDHLDPIWPYSVKISDHGVMAITDTQYYRVLLWKNWREAFSKRADVVIGQKDLEGNGQNQFGWFPEAYTLNWCYDSCFYRDGLMVADTGNSRVLWFQEIPTRNSTSADEVIGQDDFKTGSENKNTIQSTEGSLYWPFQLSIEDDVLAIADTGNHRVVINHLNFK